MAWLCAPAAPAKANGFVFNGVITMQDYIEELLDIPCEDLDDEGIEDYSDI